MQLCVCACMCACASVFRAIFNPSAFTDVHTAHTHSKHFSLIMWGPSESRSTPGDSNMGETERFVKNYLRARRILIVAVFIKTNICASDTVI